MSFSDFNIHAVRMFQQQKKAQRQKKLDALYELAVKDFERIVAMIITEFKPERIYQWGSLIRKDRFSENSDIDIAVEGVDDAADFMRMLRQALQMTGFHLDLVNINEIHPLYKESIIENGRLIYESGKP